jgi:hypothetical protein
MRTILSKAPLLAGFTLLCLAGCAAKQSGPTTRPLTAAERSDKALRDPFGYSPDFSDTETVGGSTAEFDRKGFRRDLGNVIDP